MASTNSSSSTSGRFQMAGLVSGLDTESLVEQMASATKNKINKQSQKVQLLMWKQESYRNVISKMSDFQTKYFSYTSSTNLKANALLAAFKAESSNSRVNATASPNATPANYNISSVQKASAATISSEDGFRPVDGIRMDFSNFPTDGISRYYNLDVTLDGQTKTMTFSTTSIAEDNPQRFVDTLNKNFDTNVFKIEDGILKADFNDNAVHNFSFSPADSDSDSAQKITLEAFGISGKVSNKIDTSSKLGDIGFGTKLKGGSYMMDINGVTFNFTKDTTVKEMMNTINSSSANAKMSFDSLSQTFKLESSETGAGSALNVRQTSGNLLNVLLGDTVKLADGSTKTLAEGSKLSGYSMKGDAIIGKPLDNTNFNALKNKQFQVTVTNANGESETKVIGLWGYDSSGTKYEFDDIHTDNSTTRGVSQALAAMNTELTNNFGADAPQFKFDTSTNEVMLVGSSSQSITVSPAMVDEKGKITTDPAKRVGDLDGSSDLLNALGFGSRGGTTALNKDMKLVDMLKGLKPGMNIRFHDLKTNQYKSLTVTNSTTIETFNNVFNGLADIDLNTGSVTTKAAAIAGDDKDSTKDFLSSWFGLPYDDISTYQPSSAQTSQALVTTGENASVTINGVKMASASNSIEIDGTTINFENLTDSDIKKLEDGEIISITTTRDSSKAVEAVKKFVEDYNTLLDELNKEITTFRPTSNGKINGTKYEPLTDDQKEDMSDEQIEKWEEKAKQGLLYNDSSISTILSRLRNSVMTRTSDNFSILDMGISISSDYTQNGKLIIDESALEQAFIDHPEKIQELFTTAETGLAAQVDNALNSGIDKKSGSLVMMAGVAGTSSSSNNSLSRQISSFSDLITDLETKYKNEKQRYWKQFTALETTMAKLAQQTSVFDSFTSGS